MAKAKVPIWGSTGKALIFDPEAGERALAAVEELRALIARQSSNQYHRDLLELQVGDDHPQYAMWQARETIIGQWDFTKPIWASNGSVTLPAYTFTSDTNLGFYRVGADNLGLSTNGTLRWDVGTTRVNQTLPLRIQSNSGFLLQNEGAGGFAGIEMLSFNGADPTQECGNRFAFWESPDRLYGFRFEHEGDINLTGDLDFYRHNNSAAGVLFMRFTRDSSQVQFTDGTLSEPTLTFIGDTDLGLYRFAADHLGIGADNVTHTGSDATSTSFITRNTGAGTAGYTVANTAGTQVVRFGYSNASSRPFINVQVAADMTFQQAGTVCIDFIATAGHWQTRDNVELRAGTGGDLRLFHDATNSTIRNDTGNLSINSGTTEVLRFIQGANSRVHALNGTAALPTFGWFGDTNNGFYYIGTDNFGTSAGGTLRQDWTTSAMRLVTDNYELQIGAGQDLRLLHNGTNSIIRNDTGALRLQAGTVVALEVAGTTGNLSSARTADWGGQHTFTNASGVPLTIATGAPLFQLNETDQAVDSRFWGFQAAGGRAYFFARNDADTITAEVWSAARSGATIASVVLGNATNIPPIRLSGDNQQLQLGAGQDLRLYHDGTNSIIENDTGNLVLMVNGELSLSEVTTGTTSPAAGGAGALPATPTGYVTVIINGSTRQIPYY